MQVFPFFFSSPLFCHYFLSFLTPFAYCLGVVTSSHACLFLISFKYFLYGPLFFIKKNLYWICYSIVSALFLVFWPWDIWDLSSWIKDQTHIPLVLQDEVLTTELPGKSQNHMFKLQCSLIMITVWTSGILRSFNDMFHAEITGRLEAKKGLVNFSQERIPMWWKFSELREKWEYEAQEGVGWLGFGLGLFHLLC